MARPRKYDPEKSCAAAEIAARLGGTDLDIAQACGISRACYFNWLKEYPEFLDSVKRGRDLSSDLVEQRLFARAIGYEHDAVKIFMPAGADKPVIVPYREKYAPDTGAAMAWLKNKRPDQWRDKRDVSHDVSDPLAALFESIAANGKKLGRPGD